MTDRFWLAVDDPTDLQGHVNEVETLRRSLSIEGIGFVDEVVVGTWFHLEAMSKRRYWARVGDVTLWVRLRKDGRVKDVSVEHHERK